jgi:hypothetical protein
MRGLKQVKGRYCLGEQVAETARDESCIVNLRLEVFWLKKRRIILREQTGESLPLINADLRV